MIMKDFLFKALFVSLVIHTVVICSSYWMKMPEIKRARDKRVEIVYKPANPQKLDISQHAVKPVQKLDLQNSMVSSNDAIGVKMNKNGQGLKGLSVYERKPTKITS